MKGLALEVVRHNVTINNLLPERFDTQRQIDMAHVAMERDGLTWEQARAGQVASIAAKRLGRPEEFGAACAFLCGQHAGFISGQNLHLDGGLLPRSDLAKPGFEPFGLKRSSAQESTLDSTFDSWVGSPE